MTRIGGAMIGLCVTPAAVIGGGAILGFVNGWAPCHGVPYSLDGAGFGALVFAWFYTVPAAILGGSVGLAFCRGLRGLCLGRSMLVIAAIALAIAWTLATIHHDVGE